MLPFSLQRLATRWLANLPGRDILPLDYTTLPGRTQYLTLTSPHNGVQQFEKFYAILVYWKGKRAIWRGPKTRGSFVLKVMLKVEDI